MEALVLVFVFVALGATCNSIMDVTSHHFEQSIFKGSWWDSVNSWRLKYVDGDHTKGRIKWYFGINKPVQLTDAWHFFKMLMIFFMCAAIATMSYVGPMSFTWWPFTFTIAGIVWNTTFSLFYDKILRRNK
jgi:hypothetical protein